MYLNFLIFYLISLVSCIVAYVLSYYREKLNPLFINGIKTFKNIFIHHLLAFFNIIFVIIPILVGAYFFIIIVTFIVSSFTGETVKYNPLVNIHFSIVLSIIILLLIVILVIIFKVKSKKSRMIGKICNFHSPYSDEKMGINGNLKYMIVFVIVPIVTGLF